MILCARQAARKIGFHFAEVLAEALSVWLEGSVSLGTTSALAYGLRGGYGTVRRRLGVSF